MGDFERFDEELAEFCNSLRRIVITAAAWGIILGGVLVVVLILSHAWGA